MLSESFLCEGMFGRVKATQGARALSFVYISRLPFPSLLPPRFAGLQAVCDAVSSAPALDPAVNWLKLEL